MSQYEPSYDPNSKVLSEQFLVLDTQLYELYDLNSLLQCNYGDLHFPGSNSIQHPSLYTQQDEIQIKKIPQFQSQNPDQQYSQSQKDIIFNHSTKRSNTQNKNDKDQLQAQKFISNNQIFTQENQKIQIPQKLMIFQKETKRNPLYRYSAPRKFLIIQIQKKNQNSYIKILLQSARHNICSILQFNFKKINLIFFKKIQSQKLLNQKQISIIQSYAKNSLKDFQRTQRLFGVNFKKQNNKKYIQIDKEHDQIRKEIKKIYWSSEFCVEILKQKILFRSKLKMIEHMRILSDSVICPQNHNRWKKDGFSRI